MNRAARSKYLMLRGCNAETGNVTLQEVNQRLFLCPPRHPPFPHESVCRHLQGEPNSGTLLQISLEASAFMALEEAQTRLDRYAFRLHSPAQMVPTAISMQMRQMQLIWDWRLKGVGWAGMGGLTCGASRQLYGNSPGKGALGWLWTSGSPEGSRDAPPSALTRRRPRRGSGVPVDACPQTRH